MDVRLPRNSVATLLGPQFKGAMDTMFQSLRIKEDAYVKMFEGKEKDLEEKVASLTKPDDKIKKLK